MKNIIALIIAGLCFFLVVAVFTTLTQNTLSSVVLKGKFTEDLRLKTTAISALGAVKSTLQPVYAEEGKVPVRAGSGVILHPTEFLNLEFLPALETRDRPNAQAAIVNLYMVELKFPYREAILIPQHHLKSFFASESFIDGSAVLQFGKESPSIKLQLIAPLPTKRLPLTYLALACLIGFAVFLIIVNTQWSGIPAFADLSLGKHISSTQEFNSINGLRGLAAILVLMSHASPGFYGIHMGLALLFILSGFLLSKPFILKPSSIFNWQSIQTYIVKRLRRILPMYYLFIFVTYGVALELDILVRHLLFIEARGHLWPMTQIFTFYMLLPIVLILTSAAYKLNRYLPLLILAVGVGFAISVSSQWQPYFNGRFHKEFFLYAFLMGVFASYIHYMYLQNSISDSIKSSPILALITSVVVILTLAWAGPVQAPSLLAPWISDFTVKCALSALIVILVLNTQNVWLQAVLSNWVFRAIGVVGFSFYLLHGLGIALVKEVQLQVLGMVQVDERSWVLTATALAVTYVMAVCAYSYIERPFFGHKPTTKLA